MQGGTPLLRVKHSLESLDIEELSAFIPSVPLTSLIQMFQNLVYLWAGDFCPDEDEEGLCIFRLNSDDVKVCHGPTLTGVSFPWKSMF